MNARILSTLILAASLHSAAALAAPKTVLPFIEDDYSAALSRAKARNEPLFIEQWAPW